MALQIVPPQQTGLGAFVEGAQPYLQLAFQAMLKRQMEEGTRQQAAERLKQFAPQLFTTSPEALRQQGMQVAPETAEKAQYLERPYERRYGKVPSKYAQFAPQRLGQLPQGMEVNLESLGLPISFKKPTTSPTVGIYTATPEGGVARTGEVPKGSKVLTPSQLETPEAKQEREISTGKSKKAEETKMEVQAIEGMVDSVWGKADSLIPATEGVQQAAITGIRKDIGTTKVGRLLGGADENAITFREFKEGTLSMLIRSLGEKGMLTDQDIARARDFEPSNWDTPKIRRDKKIAMKDFLKSKISAYYEAIQQPQQSQGFDFSNMSTDELLKRRQQLQGGGK